MPNRNKACYRYAQFYKMALQTADQLYEAGGESSFDGLRHYDLDSINIIAGHAWATSKSPGNQEAVRLCADYNHVGTQPLRIQLSLVKRIEWLEKVLRAARILEDRESELAHSGTSSTLEIGEMVQEYDSPGCC